MPIHHVSVSTRRRLLAATVPLLAAVAGCGESPAPTAAPEPDAAAAIQQQFLDVVRQVSPQVVQIRTSRGLGSGVVYDGKGDIVTNAHVAADARQFLVTLPDGGRERATLVGTDPRHDLAVIRLSSSTPDPATFGDSAGVHSGGIVFAIGNPLGLQSSVTQGIVSSVNRSVPEGNGVTLTNVIQTSAEINPGNSGGALVDLSGRVIGIPTLTAIDPELGGGSQAPGIGFAIGSDTVRRVADGLIASMR
jgi:putative serine protease PepD